MKYLDMLEIHKSYVSNALSVVIMDLINKSVEHDNDKIFNEEIFNVYNDHFTILKQMKYGTDEYIAYERTHFAIAHQLHALNDHHYYSRYNTHTLPTLMDLIEAVVDVYVSDKQYSSQDFDVENVIAVLKRKGALNVTLEELIENTLKKIEGGI